MDHPIDDDWRALRGATHTVAQLVDRRASVVAVLRGRLKILGGGGSLGGDVASFTDDTGSLQVFLPDDAPHAGFGPGRACEIEVTAEFSKGITWAETTGQWATVVGTTGDEIAQERAFGHLDDRLRQLDVSVRITAVRPIDPETQL